MITIPANILTLLKSRQQIGDNRPTAVIEFGGQPFAGTLTDPTAWTTWRIFTTGDRGHGNICETSDGRAVVAYTSNADKSVNVAFAPTIAGVLDGSETFAVGAAIKLGTYETIQPRVSVTLVDGKLRLVIYYWNTTTVQGAAEYWEDSDGKGLDFTKISDIATNLGDNGISAGYNGPDLSHYPSLIKRLPNGNLIVMVSHMGGPNFFVTSTKNFYSSDDGRTWTLALTHNAGIVDRLLSYRTRNPWIIGDDGYIHHRVASNAAQQVSYFTDSGATSHDLNWSAGDSDWGIWIGYPPVGNIGPWTTSWIESGGKIYMHIYHGGAYSPYGTEPLLVLEFIGPEPTATELLKAYNYQLVWNCRDHFEYDDNQHFMLLTENALILQGSSAGQISGAGTMMAPGQRLRPKLVTVSRSKGSASQLSVQFENTNGKYAPDPAGPWNFVMWPNNSIVAKLGYGAYLPQVFSGYPDDVRMETPPQMISITARDRSKLALDQICQWTWDGVTYYDGAWAAQDPEGIFLALATMAGFAEADIVYDVTGITIPEFRFSQQTYGDLMQSLAEKSGCEWYCDEVGKIYFKLVEYPPATPAYEFVAGVDIFSLGYTISDAEVYRDVVVTAQDADGNTVSAKVTWSAADYYGLPAHKTLLVTASDIVQTEAGCLELANKLLVAMTTKPRQVDFVATGLPNLQIGDCIKVTEASSTISEIYRVYEFEHQFDAEGSPVFATAIRCYWYAHG